eukprot:978500-Pyramimonas_sp.AAC.1
MGARLAPKTAPWGLNLARPSRTSCARDLPWRLLALKTASVGHFGTLLTHVLGSRRPDCQIGLGPTGQSGLAKLDDLGYSLDWIRVGSLARLP